MRVPRPVTAHSIEDVKKGDPRAFEALYHEYKRVVYGLCLRVTKDAADAEDITQEVFLQVYRTVSSLRNNAFFRSWLYKVTTNLILMHCRKRKMLSVSIHYVPDGETPSVLDVAQILTSPLFEPIERIALSRAIGDLPKCRRTVLLLHDIKGMSHREIAASLGVSLNTTKSNLSRAHHQLRRVLRSNPSVVTPPTTCSSASANDYDALGET